MNKNSNTYIIMYATIMAIVVAAILAVVAYGLKARQAENQLNERKSAILSAVGVEAEDIDKAFAENITGLGVVGADGKIAGNYDASNPDSVADVVDMLKDLRRTNAEGEFPYFRSKTGDYVIPVIGKGLWGDIWGYVALKPDMNTISGVVFDHKSETPGLGAEIATKEFEEQFKGKQIFDGDKLTSINVVKGGAPAGSMHAVDAVSGGTLTSRGLEEMLADCLDNYKPFFESVRNQNKQEQLPISQPKESNSEELVDTIAAEAAALGIEGQITENEKKDEQ